ncbi:DinB family protein [Flavobacterium sp.]|uniref:DinB family protein n=1 Tax=Flavobacterium sp. TaxID=239 RepID=UPI0039E2E4DC
MKRSEIHPMPEYFDRYINLTDDVTLLEALETSLSELENFSLEKWIALGDKAYAPGKWTGKDLLQHLIDTERIFAYRALAFSRNETGRMLSYDEDSYAKNAQANHRSVEDLFEELLWVRKSFLALYRSFTPEMFAKTGKSFKGHYSVTDIGFIIAGHQRWHLKVFEEKYLPLLD